MRFSKQGLGVLYIEKQILDYLNMYIWGFEKVLWVHAFLPERSNRSSKVDC